MKKAVSKYVGTQSTFKTRLGAGVTSAQSRRPGAQSKRRAAGCAQRSTAQRRSYICIYVYIYVYIYIYIYIYTLYIYILYIYIYIYSYIFIYKYICVCMYTYIYIYIYIYIFIYLYIFYICIYTNKSLPCSLSGYRGGGLT